MSRKHEPGLMTTLLLHAAAFLVGAGLYLALYWLAERWLGHPVRSVPSGERRAVLRDAAGRYDEEPGGGWQG